MYCPGLNGEGTGSIGLGRRGSGRLGRSKVGQGEWVVSLFFSVLIESRSFYEKEQQAPSASESRAERKAQSRIPRHAHVTIQVTKIG